MQNRRLVIRWGKSQGKQNVPGTTTNESGGARFDPVPGLPQALPHPEEIEQGFFNLQPSNVPFSAPYSSLPPMYSMIPAPPPPNPAPDQPSTSGFFADGQPGIHYPSQDPTRLGAINKTRQT